MRPILATLLLLLLASCATSGMGADVRADITARMEGASDPITACYTEALARDRKIRGVMVLQMVAAPDTGKFVEIRALRDEPNDQTLRQCVLAAVGTLALAKPQSTKISISYPINFQPTK